MECRRAPAAVIDRQQAHVAGAKDPSGALHCIAPHVVVAKPSLPLACREKGPCTYLVHAFALLRSTKSMKTGLDAEIHLHQAVAGDIQRAASRKGSMFNSADFEREWKQQS